MDYLDKSNHLNFNNLSQIKEGRMKNRILLILLGLLLCFSFACKEHGHNVAKESEASVEADVVEIKALLEKWVELYNAGEFDQLVSFFYAENAILKSPDMPLRKGKEDILLGYQKYDELNKEHVDSNVADEVRVSRNLAVAWGTDTGASTPRSGREPVKYTVNWLIAFERQSDGAWKCIYEMWNENPQ
jgi:ketosteroid isomerase-like protein